MEILFDFRSLSLSVCLFRLLFIAQLWLHSQPQTSSSLPLLSKPNWPTTKVALRSLARPEHKGQQIDCSTHTNNNHLSSPMPSWAPPTPTPMTWRAFRPTAFIGWPDAREAPTNCCPQVDWLKSAGRLGHKLQDALESAKPRWTRMETYETHGNSHLAHLRHSRPDLQRETLTRDSPPDELGTILCHFEGTKWHKTALNGPLLELTSHTSTRQ